MQYELFPYEADFLIIGGGIVGSSIAWWLKQRLRDEDLSVVVVENNDTVRISHLPFAIRLLYRFFFSSNAALPFLRLAASDSSFPFQRASKCPCSQRSFCETPASTCKSSVILFESPHIRSYFLFSDNDPPDVNILPMGYLFLASTEEGAETMKKNWRMQTFVSFCYLLNRCLSIKRAIFQRFGRESCIAEQRRAQVALSIYEL